MINSLTIVAKIFSNTLIFLLQKCEWLLQCKSHSHFSAKNISVFTIFQERNFDVTLAYNFVKFLTTALYFLPEKSTLSGIIENSFSLLNFP